jgi:hypothetical protein
VAADTVFDAVGFGGATGVACVGTKEDADIGTGKTGLDTEAGGP